MPNETTPLSDAVDLCRMGVDELRRAYAAGELSPVEVTEAALARADAINPEFNAFTLIDHAGALAAARASEARWRTATPLSAIDGVPTTLKELVRVAGWPARYGSLTSDVAPYDADAPSVSHLRARGAIFIGQTTSPEFGWKAVTDSAVHGITRNPWNPKMTPGGSSGGAAVAAAVGAGVLHLGTDGAGSIRIPCAFTGLSGIKPTFGRVAAYPPSPFGTLAHIGPMTRRVADCGYMLRAMSGRNRSDWAQGVGDLGPLDTLDVTFKDARVGVWSTPPCGTVETEVAANFLATIRQLEALGAHIELIELPYAETITSIFEAHWFVGAATRLATIPKDKRALIDPGFLDVAARGASMSAPDFSAAQVARGMFGAAMDALLDQYDFVVAPGTAIPAFEVNALVPRGSDFADWHLWAGFTFPINLSNQPAAVVPSGRTKAGLPISLQIIGARGADAKVLGAAAAFERAIPAYFI